ncbi:MAG: ribonuclease HII [Chloroflexi bacterium]|nr:ribonuclease HII [Chloroflexota bacterium]
MATRLDPPWPTLEFETELWGKGVLRLAGIDEVGRGALAGPVYAAAVVLPARESILEELVGVRDSKQMTPDEREEWAPLIREKATAWSLGWASCKEIDRWGILSCTYLAARRALKSLPLPPEHLLLDYIKLDKVDLPQTPLVGGDARCLSIAAASVIAKVARDAELRKLDSRFPFYGFASHKGYATEEHILAIGKHGACPQHRLSFAPMRLG